MGKPGRSKKKNAGVGVDFKKAKHKVRVRTGRCSRAGGLQPVGACTRLGLACLAAGTHPTLTQVDSSTTHVSM